MSTRAFRYGIHYIRDSIRNTQTRTKLLPNWSYRKSDQESPCNTLECAGSNSFYPLLAWRLHPATIVINRHSLQFKVFVNIHTITLFCNNWRLSMPRAVELFLLHSFAEIFHFVVSLFTFKVDIRDMFLPRRPFPTSDVRMRVPHGVRNLCKKIACLFQGKLF